jgi:XTP/dITP diphosphohydrolase
MKVLIGTTNQGKAREFAAMLASAGFEGVTMAEAGLSPIEETGDTFEENAVLKAKAYAKASGIPAVTDDSGLEIDALGGAPGVHSHRWAGDHVTDLKLALTVIDRLSGVASRKRTARLRTVVAFATPAGTVCTATRAIEGHIVESFDAAKITPGYPYRALFLVDECGKLYADLTPEEHAAVNHRRLAFSDLLGTIRENVDA